MPGWKELDNKAKAIMKRAISTNFRIDCKDIETTHELWGYLNESYNSRTGQDRAAAILAVTRWRKNADVGV